MQKIRKILSVDLLKNWKNSFWAIFCPKTLAQYFLPKKPIWASFNCNFMQKIRKDARIDFLQNLKYFIFGPKTSR